MPDDVLSARINSSYDFVLSIILPFIYGIFYPIYYLFKVYFITNFGPTGKQLEIGMMYAIPSCEIRIQIQKSVINKIYSCFCLD